MKGKALVKRITAMLVVMSVVFSVVPVTFAASETKTDDHIYKLWYDEQASDESADGVVNPTYNEASTSGWENEQLPIGNGYMGAAIFGRTDRERVQLSDKTLHTTDKGLMNFAETYIYFNHDEASVSNYYRDLNINDALASVSYDYNGVTYEREYLTSYPDNVLAIKLTASGSGNLSFSLEPMIPFLASETSVEDGTRSTTCERTGTVVADETTNDLITLSGHLTGFEIDYEAQYKVVPTGGTMVASNAVPDKGKITVTGADSAIIYVALDTNYVLSSDTFIKADSIKLSGNPHPHDAVTARIDAAVTKGYDAIKADHVADVSEYFDRVTLNLTTEVPSVPTDELLANYRNGDEQLYLEELIYQYGRYLLIASSRENSLPAHLTGAWNAYDYPICLAGYWHNINLQMNYWGVFSSNLTEMFESYVNLYEAFLPDVSADASSYIKTAHPDNWDSSGNNGWGASTRVTPYSAYATRPSGIDGAGTGAMAADMLWDYYEFTGDADILENVAYPAISGSANYMSRQMEELDAYPGLLLIPNSGSPENHVPEINADGAAFAQGWAYSNYLDTLKGAELLGVSESDTVVSRINDQIDKIDPIQIGYSGQIKEFREETTYGEYGEWNHRHISHLIGAFPADFINSSTPAWQDAVDVAIEKRGESSPSDWGWEFAHRMNVCARTGDGNTAYDKFQLYINRRTKDNLWSNGAFQIDGNLGIISGVDEMLLQSHEGTIQPLAAMPDAWSDGSYDGLVARGNFVIGATWKDAQAEEIRITSRNGGECKVEYKNAANATLKNSGGSTVPFTADGDVITFNTTQGESYTITNIPAHNKVAAPTDLEVEYGAGSAATLTWTASEDADTYTVYRATNSSPTYDVIATDVNATTYTINDVAGENQYTYAVSAVGSDGNESSRDVCTTIAAITPAGATGVYLDETTLQLEIDKSSTATGYRVFADDEFVMESPYSVIVLTNADSSKTYTVKAVLGELIGAEVAVAVSADATTSKQALYNEIIRADAIDLSQYDEAVATSVTNEKNKAVAVLEADSTEAAVTAATAELKDVLDNLNMIVALGKLTSNNTRIITMDKTIAVLSHPSNANYKISSDTLISSLSNTDGYTLTYVDDNKEASTTSHVISGYVKASKSGLDDVYIPVVKQGALIDNNIQDNNVTNSTTNASFGYQGGIGGKDADDISAVITVGNTASRNMPRVGVGSPTATDESALKKLTYTIEFKIYAEGDATAAVNYRWIDANDTYRLFRWEPDGTIKYNVNGTLVEGGTLERGVWHDIAIVYCSPSNRYTVYVNGEELTGASGTIAGTYYSSVLLAMENGSTNGTVAYSDLNAYYGYYYPPFKPTPEHLLLTMTSSNGRVSVGTDSIAVFSHPSNTAEQIDSDTVVAALNPDDGWTLSYVNSSKVSATSSHVKSGFIKATHDDYADVYIPITYKGAEIPNNIGTTATHKGSVKATYSYTDGVVTFTAPETATDNYSYTGIGDAAGSAGAISSNPYTISFKMRVTGDAIGVVNYRWDGDSYNIIRMSGDGTYTHMNNANTQVTGGTFTEGEWQDISIVYDAPANRYQLWVNNECKVTDIGSIPTNYFTRINFCIATGSSNGTVEFKDIEANYGYYYPPFTPTASYLLSTMISSDTNVIVGTDGIIAYSHPLNSTHQISSSDLTSALVIEDGWSMAFTDMNKTVTTVDHVKEGFIKASHAEYEDVYIPVTYKGAVIDNDHSDNAVNHKGSVKATYAYADGVATFTAGATATDSYSFTGIGAAAGSAGAISSNPYTISFKMKTTGNAIGAVNYRWDGDGFELFRIEANGTYKYRTGGSLVAGGSLSKDTWHDISIVYTGIDTNRYQIWVNGECKSTDAIAPTNYFSKMVFAIATGSMNGTVAYKDFDTHYGFHYESEVVDTVDGELEMSYDDHVAVEGTIVIEDGDEIVEVDGDGKLHAIGVGETTISIGGQNIAVTVTKAKLNVVLIAGQSNAAGVHGNRNTDAISPEVGYGYYWNGTSMTDLKTHISAIETSIGFYPALAYEWNELSDEKVYVIHHTYSGNPLSKWASYTDGTLNSGTTATVATIEAALAAIDTSKFEVSRTGYYWLQGETDAFIDTTLETTMYPTAEQYKTAFMAVHNAFTEALGDGSYGAIMSCRTRNNITAYENIEYCGMRVAQQDIANQNADIFMASVITDDWNEAKSVTFTSASGTTITATTSELGANNIHYSQKGYNVIGMDAADNMYTALTETVAITDLEVVSHDGYTVYENNSTIDVADNMRYVGVYNTFESNMAQIVARPMPVSYDSTSVTFTVTDSNGNAVSGVIDNRGYIDTTKVSEPLTLTVVCDSITKTFTLENSAYTPSTEDIMESITSSLDRVIVGDNEIIVFSHPTNESYQLGSDDVASALSATGWTLSYVDTNKAAATVDHVTEGYIKATHTLYDDTYIPITVKGDDIANNIGSTTSNYGNASTAATYSYADGVLTYTVGETALTGYKLTGIGAATGSTGAILQLPYTLKFKMKTTGDAIGVVNMRNESDGQNLVRFNADDTLQYRGTSNDMLDGGTFIKDEWYDIVLVYDQPANKYQIWIDGVCLIENSGSVAGNATNHYSSRINFCLATGSADGTASFKDFEGYYGYYSVVENPVAPAPADVTLSKLATSDVYEKDGTEYVFVAVTTPMIEDISLYNTFVCTDGETVKGVALTDLITTVITGGVEVGIIVENVKNANADNFKAAITATTISEMN